MGDAACVVLGVTRNKSVAGEIVGLAGIGLGCQYLAGLGWARGLLGPFLGCRRIQGFRLGLGFWRGLGLGRGHFDVEPKA